MCFVPTPTHSLATAPAAHHLAAGSKRPRAEQTTTTTTTTTLALYDPSTASHQQRASSSDDATAQASSSSTGGALVPFVPPPSRCEPINAVPLRDVAPSPRKLAPNVARAEPPWLRMGLLLHLNLRIDLPVYFIDEKMVTVTDLDRHQNRFRLPSEGVVRNLRPVLSAVQREAANLVDEEAPRPPRLPKLPLPMIPGEEGPARKKRKGKKHGGLPVIVIEPRSGIRELQLSRWDSSGGTVIKGEGYLDFINNCGFKPGDVVEIWAFKDIYFRLFGTDVCHDGSLHVLITKKGHMLGH